MRYVDIKDEQPDGSKIFFAFSKSQFEEGLEKIGAQANECVQGLGGVIGKPKDVAEFEMFYTRQAERIAKECTPQEVYEHEFWNHESALTWDDTIARSIAEGYFGKERCDKEIISLFSCHSKYRFWNARTKQWQHYTYSHRETYCNAIFDSSGYCSIANNLGLNPRDVRKVIPLN